MKSRISKIARKTKETDVNIELNIDGSGNYEIDTSIPFFNHMLELFARHGLFDLKIKASGDIDIDYHHTVEDVGIVLGQAVKQAVADKAGIIDDYSVDYLPEFEEDFMNLLYAAFSESYYKTEMKKEYGMLYEYIEKINTLLKQDQIQCRMENVFIK